MSEQEEQKELVEIDIYNSVRGVSVKLLNRIDRTDAYLDKLLDVEMRAVELSGQDKALLFEIVHGVVRWMGRLDWVLTGFYKGQFSKAIPNVKNGLRVALYQILFLDKIPEHAAVNEAVELVKKLQGQKSADLTNAVLRNIIRTKNSIRYPDPEEDLVGYLAAFYSHPSWMIKRWLEKFSREQVEALMNSNNERANLTLRANTLKISSDEFQKLLISVNLKFIRGKFNPLFFKLQNLSNITQWKYFYEGYFNIQDESTGLACLLLDPKPGMRVLDMCAAPGGKTAFIADMMKDTGEIVALDRYDSRLTIVEKNFNRLGLKSTKIISMNALNYNDEKKFDRVLVDVPCSGTGTLAKKPDIKWKKDLQEFKKLIPLQRALLDKAASLVKDDGAIVYSTCSIENEENFENIKYFLEQHPEFELITAEDILPKDVLDENGCIQTYPHLHQMDGAFAAKLIKKKN